MIYFKIIDNDLNIIGDIATLANILQIDECQLESLPKEQLVSHVDLILTEEEWRSYNYLARLEDGKIVFGPTTEQLAAQVRSKRNALLSACDVVINQLMREERLASNEEMRIKYSELIGMWDAYAKSLCDLPAEPGFPWDGGGNATPWPEEPENKNL